MNRSPWQVTIRDWTGVNIVVPDLDVVNAHAQLRGIQKGLVPPSSTVPSATLVLRSAKALDALTQTDPTLAASIRADYALLWEQRRVEIYFRGIRKPLFTGRLRTPHEDPSNYTWDCVDSTQDLVDGRTEKQEFFDDTSSNVFKACLWDYLKIYADDFATADMIVQDGTSTAWGQYSSLNTTTTPSADPNGRLWAAATNPGEAWTGTEITTLTAGRSYYLSEPGNTPAYLEWAPAMLEGTVVITATAAAQKVRGGLVLGYVHAPGDPQDGNRIVASIMLDVTAGAGGEAKMTLEMDNGTSPVILVSTEGDLIDGVGTLTRTFQLRVYTNSRGFQVLVNGQQIPGAEYIIANAAWGRSVGFYASNVGASNGGSVFASDIWYYEKRPLFLEGAITSTGTVRNNGPYAEAELLEVASVMAAQEDFDMRKNPLPAMDSFDFGANLGTATGIVFSESREGSVTAGGSTATPTLDAVNGIVVGTTLEFFNAAGASLGRQVVSAIAGSIVTVPIALAGAVSYGLNGRIIEGYPKNERNQIKLATELRVSGRGQGSSPPVYVVRDLAAHALYGRLSRPYPHPDVADFDALRKVARVLMPIAKDPEMGRTVQVDMSGHEGDLRELDTAIFDAPWAGLTMSVRQVMGIDLTMGSPVWTLYLDQYPDHIPLADIRSLYSQIQKLANGSTAYSTPATLPGIIQTASGIRVTR